jgi:cytochrome c peroxidase
MSSFLRIARLIAAGVLVGAVFAANLAASESQPIYSRAEAFRRAAALSELGRRLFFEPALSASGKLSCASCHSPDHAFGPPNELPVQFGGADLRQPGLRAVPSLKYLQAVPQFTEHFFESEDDGDESVDNGPTGGLTWDGRADRGSEQARVPLLSPFEMANTDSAAVVRQAKKAGYGPALRALFGAAALKSKDAAFAAILKALETYEQEPATFYPYSSKYDAYLAGKASLTEQESRGLALFNDPAKGNCAFCHISKRGNDGTPPQFTDFGFIAIGVPRNPAIPANADPHYVDLGLCGPLRTDLASHPEYCGLFRTPTLRNVATRHTFFHNGLYHDLKDVIRFYAERDTDPAKFYPKKPDGSVDVFDDLPPPYRANLNTDPPFDRHLGDKPALNDAEIDDLIAFLQTLTDGYVTR